MSDKRLRIASVDLVSNTCFPVLAADELGLFKAEGIEIEIVLHAAMHGTKALRSGDVDLMAAGSVYDVLTEFPDWRGAKVVVALSQGTPWLLVVRADLNAKRGDLRVLKGLRLTAAEGPDLAFKQMLIGAGMDPERDLEIVRLPGAKRRDVSFGVFAAHALMAGQIDGFWANALGAETAIASGAGTLLADVRRGDDPGGVRHFTFAGLATTDDCLRRDAGKIEAAVRAIVKAQRALRADPSLARTVGAGKFPPDAAALIGRTIERDVPFYDPVITEEAVGQLNRFAQAIGHLSRPVPYGEVVDVRMQKLWGQ